MSDRRIRALLAQAAGVLAASGVEAPRRTVAWMLGDLLGCSRATLLAHPEREATPAQAEALARMVARRLHREPLAYILGHADFYGLRLRVTPDVLIPRPETEQVVGFALDRLGPVAAPRVLDVGTGSGCIALAIRHARPDALVTACDVSEAALAVARANAAALGLSVVFVRADVRAPDFPAHVPGGLDLLVSNPPYVADEEVVTLAPEVRHFEPPLALFAGDDPLCFYQALARQAPSLLQPGAHVVFETHADHADGVCAVLRGAGFTDVTWEEDLAGMPRIATGRWPGHHP